MNVELDNVYVIEAAGYWLGRNLDRNRGSGRKPRAMSDKDYRRFLENRAILQQVTERVCNKLPS